jgi:hypothetical protein
MINRLKNDRTAGELAAQLHLDVAGEASLQPDRVVD